MPSNTMADTKLCFVISPIGEEGSPIRKRADNLVDYVLRPVLEPLGFEVGRADHMAQPSSITSLVIENVINSTLVVADLTGRNPNVYYELALRHAVQKPYIQVIDSRESSLPFDIKDESTVSFDITDLRSVDQCKIQLQKHVDTAMADGFNAVTPIGRALQLQSAMKEGGQNAVILRTIEELRRDLSSRPSYDAPLHDRSFGNGIDPGTLKRIRQGVFEFFDGRPDQGSPLFNNFLPEAIVADVASRAGLPITATIVHYIIQELNAQDPWIRGMQLLKSSVGELHVTHDVAVRSTGPIGAS